MPIRRLSEAVAVIAAVGTIATSSCAGTDDRQNRLEDAGVRPVDGATVDAAVPACLNAEKAAAFEPSRVVVGPRNVCGAGDASAFYDTCVGAAGDAARCQAFLNAHVDCAKCLAGPSADASGRFYLPALLQLPSGEYIPNVGACSAVALGNAAECGVAYVNEDYCTRSACAACPAPRFGMCLDSASLTVCSPYVAPSGGDCEMALTDGHAAVDVKCVGEDVRGTFLKVAGLLCE